MNILKNKVSCPSLYVLMTAGNVGTQRNMPSSLALFSPPESVQPLRTTVHNPRSHPEEKMLSPSK